ncbi:MAG: hypothetical protein LBC39_08890 [Methanobrevibacter sp.]|jgi:hypothetical protein|nr:hypothetical protein [Candidatus Methanovirga aequatorialis]
MLIKENLINKYDVYTFDVVPLIDGQINNKNHHYLYCDLSVGVNKTSIYEIKMIRSGVEKKITLKNVSSIIDLFNGMIKKKIIKSPDIITSSTLCQSFSSILSMKNGGTCF